MSFRDRVGLNIAPLFLRVALGASFIYAGWGKLLEDMPVRGEAAATLANLGFIDPPVPGGAAPGEPAQLPEDPPETPDTPDPADGVDAPAEEPPAEAMAGGVRLLTAQASDPAFTAADFAEPVEVKRRLGLVLLLNGAAQNGDWPAPLASPFMLNALSWTATLSEFLGGWLILLGFLTRVWALGFVNAMLVALWLTQIAPAVGAPNAFLGFLPEMKMGDPAEWTKAYQLLFYQFTLLGAALAVVFLGPGKLSLDALVFRKRSSSGGGGGSDEE